MVKNMTVEIKLPKEIEIRLRKDKNLRHIIVKRLEREIVKGIKDDLFFVMLFDDLLRESELTEEDVKNLDRKIKEGIVERLGWKS